MKQAAEKIIDIARRRKAEDFRLPSSFNAVADAFGLGKPEKFKEFRLRRIRNGVEVFLWADGDGKSFKSFGLNLSAHTGIFPKYFKEARLWIQAIESRYGLSLNEVKKSAVGRGM